MGLKPQEEQATILLFLIILTSNILPESLQDPKFVPSISLLKYCLLYIYLIKCKQTFLLTLIKINTYKKNMILSKQKRYNIIFLIIPKFIEQFKENI